MSLSRHYIKGSLAKACKDVIKHFGGLTNKAEIKDFVATQDAFIIENPDVDIIAACRAISIRFEEPSDIDFNNLHVPGTAKHFKLIPHQLANAYAIFTSEYSLLPTTILSNDIRLGKTLTFLTLAAIGEDFEAWPTVIFEPANLVAQVFGEVTGLWGKYFKKGAKGNPEVAYLGFQAYRRAKLKKAKKSLEAAKAKAANKAARDKFKAKKRALVLSEAKDNSADKGKAVSLGSRKGKGKAVEGTKDSDYNSDGSDDAAIPKNLYN
ncbi:hypothetical protein BT67DRAFT_433929 [Trichocladium antarcticum]|uniref:Uncharacterized protein n=1 Tax=Trichocladium antarcticum TaxID=1450529 RepID=A0AAN6ULM4_9PEZI|nr:hypothetical protein BT67DRAFT_433929 [Trichocladium antarcticum]